jgi:PKD repeat protein
MSVATAIAAFMLLILPLMARGQTPISITGASTTCKGSQNLYSIPLTPGVNYQWYITGPGAITAGINTSPATVLWTGSGSATLTVIGTNSSNTIVEQGTKSVTVNAQPKPYLTWDAQVGCQVSSPIDPKENREPNTDIQDGPCIRVCEFSNVTYTVANGGVGSTYQWTVTGGNVVSQSGNTATINWGQAGQGSLTVTETTATGCVGTRTMCIEIVPGPNVNFTMMPDNGGKYCVDQLIYFNDASDPGNGTALVSWFWDFGDGTTSTAQNPTHSYSADGTYKVVLKVTNACNCTREYAVEVEINKAPVVKIECPSVVCEKQMQRYTIDLDYLKSIGIDCDKFVWDAIGGTIPNPSTSNPYVDIVWDSVDPLDGFGYVIFNTDDCKGACPGKTMIKIPVILTNGQIKGPNVVCPGGKQYRFSLPQWPGTVFKWSIATSTGAQLIPSDQINEIILQTAAAGTITLNVHYENTMIGCSGNASIQIQVSPPVSVNGPLSICSQTSATYSLVGTTNPGDWVLNGPGGILQTGTGTSFTANFPVGGTYTLTTTGSFCLNGPLNIDVQARPVKPDSLLGPDTICLNTPYEFKAKNAISGTVFGWSVVNGSISGSSSGNNITAQFTGAGPWIVKVWRENTASPFCKSDTITKQLYQAVMDPQISGPTTVCANSYQNYTSSYTAGDNYQWTIIPASMGSVATGGTTPNAQILWNKVGGAAKVIVTVKKCTQIKSDTFDVTVITAPVLTISASPAPVCSGSPVTFSVTSVPALTSWTSINWDLATTTVTGGGTSVSHTYTNNSSGNTTYPVSVNIVAPNGCADAQATYTIHVKPVPVANISPAGIINICPPNSFPQTMTATLTSGPSGTNTITWVKVGTGNVGTGTTYSAPGTGTYYVNVQSTNGCTTQSNQTTYVSNCGGTPCTIVPAPTLTANATVTDCGEVTFTYSHTGSPISTSLSAPPNATLVSNSGGTAVYTFTEAGQYTFTYWTTYLDINNQPCLTSKSSTVIVPYIADLNTGIVCGTTPNTYNVTLFDHSNLYPGTSLTYSFFITNMTTPVATGTATSYTTALAAGNTYQVALEITDGIHPPCKVTKSVVLPAWPVASFIDTPLSPVCEGVPIKFNNTSTPSGLAFDWSFGDLTGNLQTSPSKVYTGASTPTVVLLATDKYGCTSTANKTLDIKANQLAGVLNVVPATVCSGDPIYLSFSSTGLAAPTDYYWMKDATVIGHTTSNAFPIYEAGNYGVVITGAYGCFRPYNAPAGNFVQAPEAVITGQNKYCSGSVVQLNGYAGPGAITYYWYKGGVLQTSGTTPSYSEFIMTAGTYNYQLVTAVTSGSVTCYDTSDIFPVKISPYGSAPGIVTAGVTCDPYLIELTAVLPAGAVGTVTWSNGMSGSPIYVNAGGPYKVYFTDTNNCTTSSQIDVDNDPEKYIWVFPNGCYELCKNRFPFWLHGPSWINYFNFWEWTDHTWGNSYSGAGSVDSFQIFNPGTYTLTLQNDYCTRKSEPLNIDVLDNCDCELEFRVERVETRLDENGKCYYHLDISFFYPGFPPSSLANVVLTSPQGTFVPGGATFINTPGGPMGFDFIPNPGFTGGPITIYVSGTIVDKDKVLHCYREIHFELPKCESVAPCNLDFRIVKIWLDNCTYQVQVYVGNPSGVPVNVTLYSPEGSFSPSTVTVAPGGGTYTLTFVPNPGFSGGMGSINFTTTYTDIHNVTRRCDVTLPAEWMRPCPIQPCNWRIYTEYFWKRSNNPCVMEAYFYFFGTPFGTPASVTITSSKGTFSPSTFTANPTGSQSVIVNFTPGPGYTGGPGVVRFTAVYYVNGRPVTCYVDVTVTYPPPCTGGGVIVVPAKKSGETGDAGAQNEKMGNIIFGESAMLKLSPNPATYKTTISFSYTGRIDDHLRTIDVYDLTGRLIERMKVTEPSGSRILDMSKYPASLYLVIMKEDGKVIMQEKLTITR